MLRIALLADRLGHEELTLLRGLRRHEFHVVTATDPGSVTLPHNVVSHTNLPTRLPGPATGWQAVESAARQVCRSYGPAGEHPAAPTHHDRMLTAGLRLLSRVADVVPGDGHHPAAVPAPDVIRPSFGPHPLAGLRLDALYPDSVDAAAADSIQAALRPLALRLPPVHVVHAIGPAAELAALAHNWRRGVPYILSGPQRGHPLSQLCHDRASRVVTFPLALDPADYPPRRTELIPPAVVTVDAADRPLGAGFFAQASVVAVTCGASYPLIEAMLCGLPVVAYEADGVAGLLGDAGVIVPAGDQWAMRSACARFLSEPMLRWQLGLRARRRALARHAIEPWLAAHEEHYAAVAA